MRFINERNFKAYLSYLSKRTGREIPESYCKEVYFAGKTPDQIASLLKECYEAINISLLKGRAAEGEFSNDDVGIKDISEPQPGPDSLTTPTRPPSRNRNHQYAALSAGIGPDNYLAYVHWLSERFPALEAFPVSVSETSRDEVERLLHRLYQLAGILPHDAAVAERSFSERYPEASKPSAEKTRVSRLTADNSHGRSPQPPICKDPSPVKKPEDAPPRPQVAERKKSASDQGPATGRGKQILMLSGALILAAFVTWIIVCYLSYRGLPFVYTLADNVAVRKEPNEQGYIVGRMDLFGAYPDGKGGSRPSVSSYKVAGKGLSNGYYRISASEGFFDWLFSSERSHLYVHKDFVSEDPAEQQKMLQVFRNLQGNFNELDKLNFAVRRFIIGAFSGDSVDKTIAPSCEPSAVLSKESGVSIFKKYDRGTREVVVLIQCTDGYCYCLQGAIDSAPASMVRIKTNAGEDLPAGGLFTLNSKTGRCNYVLCETKAAYQAISPYSEFTSVR